MVGLPPVPEEGPHPDGAAASSDLLDLTLTAPIQGGQMLARVDGRLATFVHGGVPGETVQARVLVRRRNYWEAAAVAVTNASPARVVPPCPYFGENGLRRGAIDAPAEDQGPVCGGCQFQHLSYEQQLRLKATVLRDVLRRVGKIVDPPVAQTIPSPIPYAYRNKASWLVTEEDELAYHAAHSHTAVPIESCHLLAPGVHAILEAVRKGAVEVGLAGLARGLEARVLPDGTGAEHGALLLHLLPNSGWDESRALAEALLEICPGTVGAAGLRGHEAGVRTLAGEPRLLAGFLGERLAVSPTTFFQVNIPQAEALARYVLERSNIQPRQQLLDVYSGAGTFTIPFARLAEAVIAIEIDEGAVADARQSIAAAGLDNVTMLAGDAATNLRAVLPGTVRCAVLDPPRAGCDPQVLRQLVRIKAPRLLYVSCDAATLARDLRALLDGGYELEVVQPFDLFPQTAHIESVSTLRLRAKFQARR